ncbi:MAG: Fur family transcriptional regulator [Deltaproteobacteria bacterium]|nr:Fur family transcriptional regulator [Deltaproteobacteria bacterium]
MTTPQNRLTQMVDRLKAKGLRLTPQRLAILRLLAAGDGHPSIEAIYDRMKADFPTMSIATVYKTMALLKELGEVLELAFPGGVSRYDGRKPFPHPHLICLRCKKIMDPELGSLEHLTEAAGKETGFRILSHRLDFFGLCPECTAEIDLARTISNE